jgi:hypothetical protein
MSIFGNRDAAGNPQRKSIRSAGIAVVTAIAVGGAMMAATAPAEAHYWHGGGAVAAGVLGGLAVGTIVGSALAAPPAVVYDEPVYDEPVYPAYGPHYVAHRLPACENFRRVDWRRRVWIDDYGRAHPCY